ncbi:DUF3365 domain-containing protein [Pseudohalioglobus lutimaris]|uniref:DUF3365 domain-containing protein n=2 Tax=Pseudohalioglobus lutimaris TaxID=1737061 RepID=A0A2N5WYU7_9GAMM|nr:DUF3365 domain-containing protein [Pseudohalioglobus lutimaris]
MRKIYTVLSLITCAVAANSNFAATPDQEVLIAEAQGLVNAFAGRLKPELKQALSDGGPTLAIEVCASQAPKIADALAAESGWSVSRVSLKERNATRAKADDWERAVLEEFDQRAAAGEPPPAINTSDIRNGQFRYMQAQGVEGVCLLCHGEELSEEVRTSLEQYYPDDMATGYSLGQVRGAISLSREF